MGRWLQLPELPTPAPGDALLIEFGLEWAEFVRMWRMLLAMAVRDGASSVHYHPWRADGHLSYIVNGVRHGLIPPPPAQVRRVAAAAGALMCGGLGAVTRRWFGWPVRASGCVCLGAGSGSSDWAGVVWATGSRVGVEWYRLT